MLLQHHQQPLGGSKKLTTKLEKPHLMKTLLSKSIIVVVALFCMAYGVPLFKNPRLFMSKTQIAEDLARQYWYKSVAKTESQAKRWERSKAVAEAWLVAGNIEHHKKWVNISLGDSPNELDRQQKQKEEDSLRRSSIHGNPFPPRIKSPNHSPVNAHRRN